MRRIGFILTLDIFLFALGATGIYRIVVKAGFPIQLEGLIVHDNSEHSLFPFANGDTIKKVATQTVRSADEIEFLCNEYSIGDSLTIEINRAKIVFPIRIALVRDYSTAKLVSESIVAIIFFLIGVIVLFLQPKVKAARIFHHLCIAISLLIVLTSGKLTLAPIGLGYLIELLFQTAYLLVPVLFLHFTMLFPSDPPTRKRTLIVILYSVAVLLSIVSGFLFLRAAYPTVDLQNFGAYALGFKSILIFFSLLFFAALWNIIHSYRVVKEEFERRKLRWVLLGILIGTCPYLFLSLVPRLLFGTGVFSEEVIVSLAVVAPISFAIGIVRFRLLDIDLLYKRSTVYVIAISILIVGYLLVVASLSAALRSQGLSPSIADIIGALSVALLFEPLRKRVQTVVDTKFFHVNYDFHKVQLQVLESIKFAPDKLSLARLVVEGIQAPLSVTKIGFFIIDAETGKLRILAHDNFDMLEGRSVEFFVNELKSSLELPVALEDKIEPDLSFELADEEVFLRWELALALPLLSSTRAILGFIVLGEKRSGSRFTLEDMTVLSAISTQSGLALERIAVTFELLIKQAESERLAELGKLKSYFVSSVSHDLKTPLTSIRLFAELLQDRPELPPEQKSEYLNIIHGETERLSRLITNVLDFAQMEKGVKEYHFKPTDLNEIAGSVMELLDYQIRSNGFHVETAFDRTSLRIMGDVDALKDVVINLISNAMKYSSPHKRNITITTKADKGQAIVTVTDEGYGIAAAEISHIFEPFYRIPSGFVSSIGGAGLGLSLVKHTMDAHNGTIEVMSEIGKGSIFALYFPLIP